MKQKFLLRLFKRKEILKKLSRQALLLRKFKNTKRRKLLLKHIKHTLRIKVNLEPPELLLKLMSLKNQRLLFSLKNSINLIIFLMMRSLNKSHIIKLQQHWAMG